MRPLVRRLSPVAKAVAGSRLVRWGFVAIAAGLGGWAVARDRTAISKALTEIGPLTAAARRPWLTTAGAGRRQDPVPRPARQVPARFAVADPRANATRQGLPGATAPLGERVGAHHAAFPAHRAADRAGHAPLHRDLVLPVGVRRRAGAACLPAPART